MTRLQCSVTSCANCVQGKCALPKIRVDGPGACTCRQTCCCSFEEKTDSACSAVSQLHEVPDRGVHISCRAAHCRYNEGGQCAANRVEIWSGAGDCTCVSSETECCTFELR